MTDPEERIVEIEERLEGCIRTRANSSMGDPEIIDECHRARDDLDSLLEVARAARDATEAYEHYREAGTTLGDDVWGALDRLRDALEAEKGDDDGV